MHRRLSRIIPGYESLTPYEKVQKYWNERRSSGMMHRGEPEEWSVFIGLLRLIGPEIFNASIDALNPEGKYLEDLHLEWHREMRRTSDWMIKYDVLLNKFGSDVRIDSTIVSVFYNFIHMSDLSFDVFAVIFPNVPYTPDKSLDYGEDI